jgi:hypothetical protein
VCLGLARLRKELPDCIVNLNVGDRIGTRRAPDRRLVNQNYVLQVLTALNARERADGSGPLAALLLQSGVDDVVDQRRFARARHACDAHGHV